MSDMFIDQERPVPSGNRVWSLAFIFSLICLATTQAQEPGGQSELEDFPISAAIEPGPTENGLYDTVTPFEHADWERTHLHRADFAGSMTDPTSNLVTARRFDGNHEAPYNIVTRDRDEVFLFGGTNGENDSAFGPYVVKFDQGTGGVVWRTDLRDTRALGEFLWPGLVTAHGNGDLYAIYGTRLARLDPETGAVLIEVQLPIPDGFQDKDITFNGFTVLRSGVIIAKSYGRPDGCTQQGANAVLECVSPETPIPPSIVVAVDPETLSVLDTFKLSEGSGGRITSAVFRDREYIYLAGLESIVRFEFIDQALTLDPGWVVADYIGPGQTAASATVVMGDWIVFQTNTSLSTAPLSVYAVSQSNADTRLRAEPFPLTLTGLSVIPSALTVDPDSMLIFPMDAGAGQLGALELVDGERLEVRWTVNQTTINHTSLVGPPEERVFVSTQAELLIPGLLGRIPRYFERMVWRSAATGEVLARSGFLPPKNPGVPVAPGFFGVWYYLTTDGIIYEVSVESRGT